MSRATFEVGIFVVLIAIFASLRLPLESSDVFILPFFVIVLLRLGYLIKKGELLLKNDVFNFTDSAKAIVYFGVLSICKDHCAVYNSGMAKKKITLEALAAQMQKSFASIDTKMQKSFASVEARMQKGFASVDAQMEKGFSAVAEDIADVKGDITGIKRDVATKDQVVALHTQVNSIETQLRDMKYIKMEGRVADLEEKNFGKTRA